MVLAQLWQNLYVLASMMLDGGFGDYVVAATSSHFSSAERQFRFPLEYGSQRSPYSSMDSYWIRSNGYWQKKEIFLSNLYNYWNSKRLWNK